jgi:hypothetical protein
MANEMRTFVTVKSEDPKVATRLQEIFKPREGEHEATAIDVINNIKGTTYSFQNETTKEDWNREIDFPSNELWEEMIGPKWLYVEYDHQELPENCNIVLRTAWSVPAPFLNILRNQLQEIDPECYIVGTYEDEGYDPCGAFVYGKFDYDDMEDYDDVFDWDEYEEDEFYLENFHDQIYQLEKDVENAYLEYLQDRIDNPEDYEGFE